MTRRVAAAFVVGVVVGALAIVGLALYGDGE